MSNMENSATSFNKYCKEKNINYRIKEKDGVDCVILKEDGEKKYISEFFITIPYVYGIKTKYFVCYELEIDTYDGEIPDALCNGYIVYNLASKEIGWAEVNNIIALTKNINSNLIMDVKHFKKFVKEFVLFSLNSFLNSKLISRSKVGWNIATNDSVIFNGVTHPAYGKPTLEDTSLFEIEGVDFKNLVNADELYKNEDLNSNATDDERRKNINESAENVLVLLQKHPDLCVLFAYNILSLTYRFFDDSENSPRFPICVCGRNKNITAKIVANIFCNMQLFNPKRTNTIPAKTNINYTSIFSKLDNYYCYCDIIMLIQMKNGLNKSRDRSLVKIISETINGQLGYFPLFITEKEPDIPEVINVNVSNFNEFPSPKNYEEIENLKISLNRLLLEYIIFLYHLKTDYFFRNRSNNNLHIETLIQNHVIKHQKRFESLDYLDSNVEGQYLLYIKAMSHFSIFLNRNSCKDISERLSDLCFEAFKMRATDSINAPTSENVLIDSFKNYIKSIFVDKTLTPNYFYTECTEKRGNRETCYYLEYSHFYCDFCNNNSGITIDERHFLQILKTAGLIKTRPNVSYGFERKFDEIDKKIYVLAVIKEKIHII